ncbi:hypothetical protein [Candidatus Magnetominusculus xianensis]|uniref:Secreted protein n=1 Tax=Candidatus Magnetominusculus xianensis TaxID=1748249 RepID=A0ABR5SBQ5_9BACT|nr:hypothetical protein [Candidatus Magnetominusculus xianensis]KWT78220.1 hypothetical protein ASN18_2947 [Candidatus Magnetominusculus xianensis]MBF0402828.1 hypothetical protein [Nitrospirota bacterium]
MGFSAAVYANIFSGFFGTKFVDIKVGTTSGGTYYVQWFTNGTRHSGLDG